MRRSLASTLVIAVVALGAAAPAAAAPLSAERPIERVCERQTLSAADPGSDVREWIAPADGLLTATLRAPRPDWDLTLLRAGRPVAASTSFTSSERASLWVERGDRVAAQACRLEGPSQRATLSLDLARVDLDRREDPPRISLHSVTLDDAGDLAELERRGFDVTHDVGPATATVLADAAERERLRRAGFDSLPLVRDVVAADAVDRAAEDAVVLPSALPSERTEYRAYAEYTSDLKALADANPGLVRSIEIGTTFEGRPIEGVEIAADVDATDDGRPVFVNLGAHHAREWPSAEMPMEFAIDLVDRWNAGDTRVRDLLERVRVVTVPIVNVDGFIASRSYGYNPLTDDDSTLTTVQSFLNQAAYIRKNCRPTAPGDDLIPCANRTGSGVDLNRNYGAYWGGPGSSSDMTTQGYRGTAPFSEPESQAVRDYTASIHPTVLITNHTFTDDGKWLRQPGFDAAFLPSDSIGAFSPDEEATELLGDSMSAATGWTSERGYETLGDITGATEDWNYFSQGTYGYTPEARGPNFHANYAQMVVDEYEGTGAQAGLGVREAFLRAAEFAALETEHGVIEGSAPAGATLTLSKTFATPTCEDATCAEGNGPPLTDELETTLTVPADGTYEWHVNPSGRPLAPAETWTMRCEGPGGAVEERPVAVGRGERVNEDFVQGCGASDPGPDPVDPGTPGGADRCAGRAATIVGTSNADRLRGTTGDDVIVGRGGDDRIKGRGGDDAICGRGGRDRIGGGPGADRLRGGDDPDRLSGGSGTDRCQGGRGRDRVRGCAG